MTQADRVHSTPPTNTSAKQSRRSILGAIAAGSIATLAPTIAESATADAALPADPIFATIDAHRKAHIAHVASLELQARFERRNGIGEGSWVSTKPCHDEDDAFMAFVAEPATKVRGLFAKLAYFDELAGEFETEWMVRERAEAVVLIQSFAASLKNIGVQP